MATLHGKIAAGVPEVNSILGNVRYRYSEFKRAQALAYYDPQMPGVLTSTKAKYRLLQHAT